MPATVTPARQVYPPPATRASTPPGPTPGCQSSQFPADDRKTACPSASNWSARTTPSKNLLAVAAWCEELLNGPRQPRGPEASGLAQSESRNILMVAVRTLVREGYDFDPWRRRQGPTISLRLKRTRRRRSLRKAGEECAGGGKPRDGQKRKDRAMKFLVASQKEPTNDKG